MLESPRDKGLHRQKACVTLASEQASLAVATP